MSIPTIINVRPGDTVTVVGIPAETPPQPPLGIWGPLPGFPTNPIAGFDPIHGTWPDKPPPVEPPPQDSGNWVWAWSPQANRWVWVKVPGPGEAGPKTA